MAYMTSNRENGINTANAKYNRVTASDVRSRQQAQESFAEYMGSLIAARRRRIAREKANAPIIVRKKVKAKPFPVSFVFYAAIVTISLFFVVYSYSVINEVSYKISEVETQIAKTKEENERLSLKLEERNDIQNIDKYASELGMVKSTEATKFYVNISGGDEIVVSENASRTTHLGTALDSVKDTVSKIYE